VLTHEIWSLPTPNCFWITGIATLTMLVSSTDMNIPMISTTSGSPQSPPGPTRSALGGVPCDGGPGGATGSAAAGARGGSGSGALSG